MPYRISDLQVDLVNATVSVHLTREEGAMTFSVRVQAPISTAGDQSERAMQATAREAAKSALLEAADAL
ncbi:hypothetical protein GCM10019059_26920 [Camelimonas fluminis]|nr:hypothetical protein GCM10019059_26920 [Camelimonas fluminis]